MNDQVEPKEDKKAKDGVVLIPYPKIVFLWPAWVVSMVAGCMMHFGNIDPAGSTSVTIAWVFLIALSLNLVVLSFDFPRTTSILLFAIIVAIFLAGWVTMYNMPNFLPSIGGFIVSLKPMMNSTFYLLFGSVMTLIYIIVAVAARFDYWEVRPNELLHHHGILSDLERFPSPHLRVDKEINDLFEFLLLGSGRLILQPSSERRSIVLDNVFFINSKEKEITKLLGALQVSVRDDN